MFNIQGISLLSLKNIVSKLNFDIITTLKIYIISRNLIYKFLLKYNQIVANTEVQERRKTWVTGNNIEILTIINDLDELRIKVWEDHKHYLKFHCILKKLTINPFI